MGPIVDPQRQFGNFVLGYVRPVIDGLAEQFGFEGVENYADWKLDLERSAVDPVPTLYVSIGDLRSENERHFFKATFIDNGDLEGRMKRLGFIFAALSIATYVNLRPNTMPGYVRISDLPFDVELQFELVVTDEQLQAGPQFR